MQLCMVSNLHTVTFVISAGQMVRQHWVSILNLPVKTLHIRIDSELQDSVIYNVDISTPSSNTSIKSMKFTLQRPQLSICRQYMLRTASTLPCIEELECKIDRSRERVDL